MKFFYGAIGATITIICLVFALTTLLPAFAGDINTVRVDADPQVDATDSEPTIRILPTSPPSRIKPTGTPSTLSDAPPPDVRPEKISGRNSPVVQDLAPELPESEKASVVLQYADGKRVKIRMAPSQVKEYISTLPEGVWLATTIPPAAFSMGLVPPTPDLNRLPKEDIFIEQPASEEPAFEEPTLPSFGND